MRVVTGRDATQLWDERPGLHRHTVKVLGLARPDGTRPITIDDLAAHLQARLPVLYPLREHVARVAGGIILPAAWVRTGVRLDDHLRHVEVGPDAEVAALEDVVGEAMASPMDLDRPLWDLTLVDGPGPTDQWLVWRIHHSVAGGPQAARLLELMFGPIDDDAVTEADEPVPSTASLVAFGLRRWAHLASRLVELPEVVITTVQALRSEGGTDLGAAPYTTPPCSWNGDVAGPRHAGMATLSLPLMRAAGRARGCTANHVLLTILGGALTEALEEAGAAQPLTTVVPVERHERTAEPAGNSSTSFGLDLAVDERDPERRLVRLGSAAVHAKARHLGVDRRLKFGFVELGPAYTAVFRLGVAIGRAKGRPPYNMIVSFVRGPVVPMAVGTSTVSSVTSFGVVVESMGLNVTAWSIGDDVHVGIVVSSGELDPRRLAAALVEQLEELAEAVGVDPEQLASDAGRARAS